MPIHDWSKFRAGVFHDFHQGWTIGLCKALNHGILQDYYALVEHAPDATMSDMFPASEFKQATSNSLYAAKANRITICGPRDEKVAHIEVVSPGNKSSVRAIDAFVQKTVGLIQRGIHVLIVDLFPPGPFDPNGIHSAIWEKLDGEADRISPRNPLTIASYEADEVVAAYVNTADVGGPIPDSPIFLKPGYYVTVPLEATYLAAWSDLPKPVHELFDNA